MERKEALGAVYGKETMIDHETQRLQKMRDNKNLGDPSELPVLQVKRQTPVTPHLVTMSVELLARNAALKAIGGCKNYADEKNALGNIEEAESNVYEADATVVKETKTTKKAPAKKDEDTAK